MPESNSKSLRPCIFFDRDGVINQSPGPGYVLRAEDFHFNPGFVEAFRVVKNAGLMAIVITSQKGVGKGLMPPAELERIHEHMQQHLEDETEHRFDAIYAFTGTPDCRHLPKPDPEMILTATNEHGINLEQSWMIGDADRDILMGNAAGVGETIRISGTKPIGPEATDNHTVKDCYELAAILTEKLRGGN